VVVVAARPGIGKTAFALNLVMNISRISEKPIVVFSWRCKKRSSAWHALLEARVENKKLKHGLLGRRTLTRLSQAAQLLYNSKIIIDDKPNITVTEVRSKARRIKNEYGDLGLIILDYIQLVDGPPDLKRDHRYVIISEVSRGLKYLAKELNVPVIALSQLSRKIEDRTDRRPLLSDLRESGQIEQDADIVVFIHRNFYYSQNDEEKNESELIIGKHRGGALGSIKLHFTGEYTRFDNASARREE
jgi:replicative DNA helicase